MKDRLKLFWEIFNPRWFFFPLFEDRPQSYKKLPYEFIISFKLLMDNIMRLIRSRFNPQLYWEIKDKEDAEFVEWLKGVLRRGNALRRDLRNYDEKDNPGPGREAKENL